MIKKARALEKYMETCSLNYVEENSCFWMMAQKTLLPLITQNTPLGSTMSCVIDRFLSAVTIPLFMMKNKGRNFEYRGLLGGKEY